MELQNTGIPRSQATESYFLRGSSLYNNVPHLSARSNNTLIRYDYLSLAALECKVVLHVCELYLHLMVSE